VSLCQAEADARELFEVKSIVGNPRAEQAVLSCCLIIRES
jgi:hypothetical protein